MPPNRPPHLAPPPGLYAITPDDLDTERLLNRVRAAISGGVRLLQYRNKAADAAMRVAQANALIALCRPAGVCLIINDDVELALQVGADGAHLGGEDGDLAAARARVPAGFLLGASCYASLERARCALAAGADYIAFGALYPSSTKPQAKPATLDLLRQARAEFKAPIAAIGGITLARAPEVIAAGADWLAVISDLFDAADITDRAARYTSLFSSSASQTEQP